MHEKTPRLLVDLRSKSMLRTRTAVLRNSFVGETAFVFSCGPSLNDVWSDRVAEGLKGRFVVAVKSSFNKIHSVDPDMYWFNPIRIPNLEYPFNPHTIRVASSNPTNVHNLSLFHHGCDLFYPIDVTNPESTLLATHNFNSAVLPSPGSLISLRPWGAGVLLDIGLFLLLYMGFKKIIVVGWDMGRTSYTHFYSSEDIMGTESIQAETRYSVSAASALVKWFAGRGVALRLCSPRSILDIPQLSVDEMLES